MKERYPKIIETSSISQGISNYCRSVKVKLKLKADFYSPIKSGDSEAQPFGHN